MSKTTYIPDDLREELKAMYLEVTERVNKIVYLESLPEQLRIMSTIDLGGKTPNEVITAFHESLIT